jgi:outer membrane lipoprotein-sorting protein
MMKGPLILLASAVMLLQVTSLAAPLEVPHENEILAVVQRMVSVLEKVEDFTCETEVTYYKEGVEDQRWRVKFFFKKEKKFRVDFSSPYKGVSIFYRGGDEELIVRPFGFLPALRFSLSIDAAIARTPSGQRIDQTDVGYFIRFVFNNLRSIEQRENEFHEDEERITFLFWAMDYLEGKSLEKYRVFVSKKIWLPLRVERYDYEGKLIELIIFKNHTINSHLEDTVFVSWNSISDCS